MTKKIFKLVNWIWLLIAIFECSCEEKTNPLNFFTDECLLTEPVYNHQFDFRALRSDLEHVVVSGKGDTFRFNLCGGNVTLTCNGHNNVAACLKRNNDEFILGTHHQLNYHNGKMYFNFKNGEKCPNSTGNFQLHVFIGCDYTPDQVQAKVTAYADEACSFYINLETQLACLPESNMSQVNSCSVKDPKTGHTFDLMPLSDSNYRTTDRRGSAFVINICKPVLYSENAMCPAESSVCFVALQSLDYKKKWFNYGSVQSKPVIENDQLLIRHTSNTKCGSGNETFSSIINFNCDKEVKGVDLKLIGLHGCVYKFSFFTPLACNNLTPCTTVTHGNEIIDLRPLQGKPITLKMDSKNYTFNICGAAGEPCLEKDGACFTANGQSTSLGISNSNLLFNRTGSPYLLYDNGAVCEKDPAKHWSTKIEFVCANNTFKINSNLTSDSNNIMAEMVLGPKIIENSHCQLLIHYQTELSCQEKIACKAKVYVEEGGSGEEEVIDLTPLIGNSENYEAHIDSSLTEKLVDKSKKFYINVCRPLVPKYGLGCPGGSAACMAKIDSTSNTPEQELGLGYPLISVVAVNRTFAELRYLRGSPCPEDHNTQLSSGIEFYCDMRAGRGNPILRAINDCHYRFEWATSVICPPHMCNFDAETCEIINDETNVRYNIKKAPFTENGIIKVLKNGVEITFDMCGKHGKAQTDYARALVNLFVAVKGSCGSDGIVNVQMRMICSSVSDSTTMLSDDTQCNLILIQHTPDICKFLGLSEPPPITTAPTQNSDDNNSTNKPNTGETHPAERTGSIGAILAAILSLTCFVACFGLLAFSPERRNSLKRCFQRSTSVARYSRVQSNEEANLLLEPNGEFTDSDDDMLL